jgi:hypothetical protein
MSKIHVDGCDEHLTFILTSPKAIKLDEHEY